MNYRSQMKAHALDRAQVQAKTMDPAPGLDDVFEMAGKIEQYVYVPLEDIRDTAKYLLDLFHANPHEKDLLDETIMALQVIQEQIDRMNNKEGTA